MMMRTGLAAVRPALRLQPPLRRALPPLAGATLARQLSASTPLLRRDDDRLPRGHVRPVRRRIRRDDTNDPNPGAYQFQQDPLGSMGFDQQGYTQGYSARPAVVVPDDPRGVLQRNHAAYELLAHDSLVVVRQLEMMNVFLGYEQANRYAIYSPEGAHVGFLAEEERGFAGVLTRQILHTHRPFKSTVMDRHGTPILWIERPFAFINSRIRVRANPDLGAVGGGDGLSPLVGETQQQWHPWRRRYNLFENRVGGGDNYMDQFARIDGGFLAWDFWLTDADGRLLATINRNFTGFGREIFTDTGQYVIRFDAAGSEINMPPGSQVSVQGQTLVLPEESTGLTLDQRAMTLATAVSIDFDYFSRHSGSGGGFLPFWLFSGGDGSSEHSRGGEAPAPSGSGTGVGTGGGTGAGDVLGGAAAGAAMGGAGGYSGRDWSDDEIYGRAPPPGQTTADPFPGQSTPDRPYEPPAPGQQAEGFDYPP
ncbi:Scramblase-domain-containing protein, partial [Cutaneotrichosporon oleaginosum]